MRSLRDTNVAKIEGDDLRIFMALLGDLFPGGDDDVLSNGWEWGNGLEWDDDSYYGSFPHSLRDSRTSKIL